MSANKMNIQGLDESKHVWMFSNKSTGLIGLSPKSNLAVYLASLTQSDLNIALKYDVQKKDKDESK